MDSQASNSDSSGERMPAKNKLLIALAVSAAVLILTWAVATFFEIALAKALAAVVIALFCVFVALALAGFA